MKMQATPARSDRRRFVQTAASAATLMVAGCTSPKQAEVTPGEDLMQEHGLLERILLVYGEAASRIERGERFDLGLVRACAEIVRRFVEGYHERLEERFVFPRLEQARREAELIAILRRQHERGREVTGEILRRASSGPSTPELAALIRSFERMYRPHAAREDTVLFPAFREVVGGHAYRELGEQFEEQEHELFGEKGFEGFVGQVAQLEATLGIGDLASFTP